MACLICFTEGTPSYPLPEHRTPNGDLLRPADNCMSTGKHVFCKPCLRETVQTRIQDMQVHNLRCPHPECTTLLFDRDVECLLSDAGLVTRYRELMVQAHLTVAHDFSSDDPEFLQGLSRLQIKACPRCRVLMQRSVGCDSMYCVCGQNFNFRAAPSLVPADLCARLRMAKRFGWTPAEVQQRGFTGSKQDGLTVVHALRVMSIVGHDLPAAIELSRAAMKGDETARQRIRDFRAAKK